MIDLKKLFLSEKSTGALPLVDAKARTRNVFKRIFEAFQPSRALLELFEPIFRREARNTGCFYDETATVIKLQVANQIGMFKYDIQSEYDLAAIHLGFCRYIASGGHGARLYVIPVNSFRSIGQVGTGLRLIYMQWFDEQEKYMFIDAEYSFTETDFKVTSMTIHYDMCVPKEIIDVNPQ